MYIIIHNHIVIIICLFSAKRYCVMLIREGGVETLKQLEKTHMEYTTQPNLQSLCQSILETLELNS